MPDPTGLDWEHVARAVAHPTAIAILEALAAAGGDARSPTQLTAALGADGAPLGTVAYHVRMLRARGLLALDRTQPRRGTLEHFYRLTYPPRETTGG